MPETIEIPREEFDEILWKIADEMGVEQVPGVYEAVSEYYNNEVIEEWERRQDAPKCKRCKTEFDYHDGVHQEIHKGSDTVDTELCMDCWAFPVCESTCVKEETDKNNE